MESRVKYFGELKTGDYVWKEDLKNWQLIPIEITDVDYTGVSYVRITLSNGTNFVAFKGARNYDIMKFWSDKKLAIENMKEAANRMEYIYIKEIDDLISQYDNLLKWKRDLEI